MQSFLSKSSCKLRMFLLNEKMHADQGNFLSGRNGKKLLRQDIGSNYFRISSALLLSNGSSRWGAWFSILGIKRQGPFLFLGTIFFCFFSVYLLALPEFALSYSYVGFSESGILSKRKHNHLALGHHHLASQAITTRGIRCNGWDSEIHFHFQAIEHKQDIFGNLNSIGMIQRSKKTKFSWKLFQIIFNLLFWDFLEEHILSVQILTGRACQKTFSSELISCFVKWEDNKYKFSLSNFLMPLLDKEKFFLYLRNRQTWWVRVLWLGRVRRVKAETHFSLDNWLRCSKWISFCGLSSFQNFFCIL